MTTKRLDLSTGNPMKQILLFSPPLVLSFVAGTCSGYRFQPNAQRSAESAVDRIQNGFC